MLYNIFFYVKFVVMLNLHTGILQEIEFIRDEPNAPPYFITLINNETNKSLSIELVNSSLLLPATFNTGLCTCVITDSSDLVLDEMTALVKHADGCVLYPEFEGNTTINTYNCKI